MTVRMFEEFYNDIRVQNAPGSTLVHGTVTLQGPKNAMDRVKSDADSGKLTVLPTNQNGSPSDNQVDRAVIADSSKGGIDFNSANLNLQIKRDGKGVPLPISQQNLESIHIDDLIPVILDIKPAVDSPLMTELQVNSPS